MAPMRWWFPSMMMAVLGVGAIIAGMLSPPPDTLGGWIIGIVLLLAAFTSLQRRKPR